MQTILRNDVTGEVWIVDQGPDGKRVRKVKTKPFDRQEFERQQDYENEFRWMTEQAKQRWSEIVDLMLSGKRQPGGRIL